MTLTDFLLARIAEDEMMWEDLHPMNRVATRLRRECEAKRRILTALTQAAELDPDSLVASFAVDAAGYAVRALAAIYADHPDYREEWKP